MHVFPRQTPLLTLLLIPLGTACAGFCTQDQDCLEDQLCGVANRCVAIPAQRAPTCSTTANCRDGRLCSQGECVFAPGCMNLAGTYEVWNTSNNTAPAGMLAVNQPLGTCQLTATGSGNISGLQLDGILNPQTIFSSQSSSGCALDTAGDETLRVSCPDLNGGTVFHLYATHGNTPVFRPTRCGPGVSPCDGRTCDARDAGACVRTATCHFNTTDIPQCTAL